MELHANCMDIEDTEYEVLTNHKKKQFVGIVTTATGNR